MNRTFRSLVSLAVGAILVAPGACFYLSSEIVSSASPSDHVAWIWLLAPGVYFGLLVGVSIESRAIWYVAILASALIYAVVVCIALGRLGRSGKKNLGHLRR